MSGAPTATEDPQRTHSRTQNSGRHLLPDLSRTIKHQRCSLEIKAFGEAIRHAGVSKVFLDPLEYPLSY